MQRLSRPLTALKPRYDAVVVGSGYGGGVAASRLARMGLAVCLLERGREVLAGEFPARFPDISRELCITGRRMTTGSKTGLYDVRFGEDMHVIVGCGLGGGSLVNAAVALRPDARVFADATWPEAIRDRALLDEGFARAARWLRPAPVADPGRYAKVRAFETAKPALGRDTIPPPLAVAHADTVSAGGIAQPACTGCGDCCGGCNVGAKTTVALTYLPDAARHGAELFTEVRAHSVGKEPDGRWRVDYRPVGSAAKSTAPAGSITARMVVLAAGTLGSTEILLRSRARGLALSDRLGGGFSANGDIIAFGYGAKHKVHAIGIGHPAKVDIGPVGPAVAVQMDLVDDGDLAASLTIQEGVLPSALAPALPVMFLPGGRLAGALQSLVSGVYKGPFANLQVFFAVSHDSARGVLSLDDDRLVLSWPGARDEPVYARLDAALTKAVTAAGGTYVKNPLAGTVMGQVPATAHPLGGCGMGEDRRRGVVDHMGRVFDAGAVGKSETAVHEGLFVLDGAVMPRSLGVNPLLTITALTERAMLLLARENGASLDTSPFTP